MKITQRARVAANFLLRGRVSDALTIGNPAAAGYFFGPGALAGVDVTEATVMRITAVWAAMRIVTQGLAMMPINLIREEGSSREIVRDHSAARLLRGKPNRMMNAFNFIETLAYNAELHGNGLAERGVNGRGETTELVPLSPHSVTPKIVDGELFYIHTPRSGITRPPIPAEFMVHVHGMAPDGVWGLSTLQAGQEALGLALAADMHDASFLKNGANPAGIIYTQKKLTEPSRDLLRGQYAEWQAGVRQAGKPLVFEEGMKYEQTGISPADAQLLETRQYGVEDIARLFGVPSHLIEGNAKISFNSVEARDLGYLRHNLQPRATRFEQAFNCALLTECERETLHFEFDLSVLLRGDTKARTEYNKAAIGNGWKTPDQIRVSEGDNPVNTPESQSLWMPANLAPMGSPLFKGQGGAVIDVTPVDEDPPAADGDGEENARRLAVDLSPLWEEFGRRMVTREKGAITKLLKLLDTEHAPEFNRRLAEFFDGHDAWIREASAVAVAITHSVRGAACVKEVCGVAGDEVSDLYRRVYGVYSEELVAISAPGELDSEIYPRVRRLIAEGLDARCAERPAALAKQFGSARAE